MSEKAEKETKFIAIRELTPSDKDRIRSLFEYGDISKISMSPFLPGYQQCLNIANPNHPSDSERFWEAALKYLNALPEVELDARLAGFIKGVAA